MEKYSSIEKKVLDLPLVLVGNKMDDVRKVSIQNVEHYSRHKSLPYVNVSVKANFSIY